MAQIRASKVVAGGVLAGLVLAAFDFATNNFLLAAEWQNVAQRHNFDPALMGGNGALVTMVIVDMALGQLIAGAYAGIRAQFGAGLGTALYHAVAFTLVCAYSLGIPGLITVAGLAAISVWLQGSIR